MQERLIVKNFGPIKDVDLDLRQTTVFIGEQASGKSTLAKLIGIFRDNQNILLVEPDDKTPFHNYQIGHFFSPNTYFYYQSERLKLIFENDKFHFQKLENNVSSTDNEAIEYPLKGIEHLFKLLNIAETHTERREIENKIRTLLSSDNDEINQKFLNYFGTQIYIPIERTAIPTLSDSLFFFLANNYHLPKLFTSFGSKFEQARQNINSYFVDFLNVEYRFQQGEDFIYHNDIRIKLSNASSGLQSIIPMILVIDYLSTNRQVNFIIEEPEVSLYPTTQHNLTKFIAAKCTSNNQQLTITTHSPYLLSSMNILLFAHQAGQIDEAETNTIIPKESWMNPKDFNAYFIEKGGTARQIFNQKSGMIAENELDNVSLDLGDEFDKLMDIYQGITV